MRAGTVVLLLALIVMGFGFLFSSNLYMQKDLSIVRQQLDTVIRDKKVVEEQLAQARVELANLRRLNEILTQEKRFYEAQVSHIQKEYVLVVGQNDRLKAQIERIDLLTEMAKHLANLDLNSLALALFIPLLPISLASSLLIYRNRKSHPRFSTEKTRRASKVISMQVTDEEMRLIRRMRRNRANTSKNEAQ